MNTKKKDSRTKNTKKVAPFDLETVENLTKDEFNRLTVQDLAKVNITDILNSQFDKELNTALNIDKVIGKAYTVIDAFVEEARILKLNTVLLSYNSNYALSVEIKPSQKHTNKDRFFIALGKMYAEHRKYIDSVKEAHDDKNSKNNKIYFGIKEQLLFLEYFGVFIHLPRTGKNDLLISPFLAALLNRSPNEVPKVLGGMKYFKKPPTKEKPNRKRLFLSLKRITDSLKMEEISRKLQADIEDI